MKKIVIITGATGGIGREFVKQMMSYHVDEIWAVARSEKRLQALREEYGAKIIPVSADLSDMGSIAKLEEKLREQKPKVCYLINNAGLARMEASRDSSQEEIIATVDVNCKAPVLLCSICLPYMDAYSRILNISSASAFQPNPYINLYAASKVFLRSYSRALNMELRESGISVTAVCPGWVDTELLPREINGKKVMYPGMVSAKSVVTKALKDAEKRRDMSVCSLYVRCQHVIVKLLPQKLVMRIWVQNIGRYMRA